MPQLLKSNTIRLLTASVEHLDLALAGLSYRRNRDALHAPHVGLIGASAELAMSACIVQVRGEAGLQADQGKFKTARQILSEFRKMLRNPVPAADFLVDRVPDPDGHRRALLQSTSGFAQLLSVRAAGFHAGRGVSRDVCLVLAQKVSDFLKTLAESRRISPYLREIPEPPPSRQSQTILLEDLAKRVYSSKGEPSDSFGVFLLLPETPDESPPWLDDLDIALVTPTRQNLDLLVSHLQRAVPVTIQRVRGKGVNLPVVVDPTNPSAIPVAPTRLRTALRDVTERWHAAAGIANGNLEEGRLTLPHKTLVYELFQVYSEKESLGEDNPTPHRLWPVALASVAHQGTPGPFWFLLRACSDLGQLRSLVSRSSGCGSESVRKRSRMLIDAIRALERGKPLGKMYTDSLRQSLAIAARKRERLESSLSGDRAPEAEDDRDMIRKISHGEVNVGEAIARMLQGKFSARNDKDARYWARLLAEASADLEDVDALVSLLGCEEYKASHTAARKALSLIDKATYGPKPAS